MRAVLTRKLIVVLGSVLARWLIAVCALINSALLFLFLSPPYIYVGLNGIVACLLLAVGSKGKAGSLLWVYGAWAFVGLLVVETFYWLRERENPVPLVEGGFTHRDREYHPDLGTVPVKDNRVHVRKFIDGELLYDVEYEFDSNGLRATPRREGQASLLFFGGSFIFGEGLRVEETIPYQVGEALDLEVYNWGFPGYGPHQALRAIECGIVEEVVELPPRMVVLYSIPNHISRILGMAAWDPYGPRYIERPDGQIVYDGPFTSSFLVGGWRIFANEVLQRSMAWRLELSSSPEVEEADIALFAKIVERMKELILNRYPNTEFHVIVMDQLEPTREIAGSMITSLETAGVSVHATSAIFDHCDEKPENYFLHRFDNHPTALANRELSQYIVKLASRID